MTTDQIQPGRKYRLVFRYSIPRTAIVAEVLRLENGAAIIRSISGREVSIPLRDFAAMAVEEVECVQGMPERRKNGTQCKVKVVYP